MSSSEVTVLLVPSLSDSSKVVRYIGFKALRSSIISHLIYFLFNLYCHTFYRLQTSVLLMKIWIIWENSSGLWIWFQVLLLVCFTLTCQLFSCLPLTVQIFITQAICWKRRASCLISHTCHSFQFHFRLVTTQTYMWHGIDHWRKQSHAYQSYIAAWNLLSLLD
jgi:hypothetical protein